MASRTERWVNALVLAALRVACRLDVRGLERLPESGPAMLLCNHTTNIEGPAYYVLVQPRPTTALAKQELWDNPMTRFLMNLWHTIPVRRGEVDTAALRACLRALDRGLFLGIAPEGTRSPTGALQPTHDGAAMLAVRRPVPVYPVAHWGLRDLGPNLRRLRRTPVSIHVGRPFRVVAPSRRPTSAELHQIATEMMYRLALLLPPELRGPYSGAESVRTNYLELLDE